MIKRKTIFRNRWIIVLGLIAIINILGSFAHFRADLTNEKRFTISKPVKKILNHLPGVVTIDVFLKGDLPSAFKGIVSYTDDLLHEFKLEAGNNIEYRFVNPELQIEGTGKTYSDTLKAMNLSPINLKVQLKTGEQSHYIFPVALLHYEDKTEPIVLYEGNRPNLSYTEYFKDINSAEALMEYKFAYAISKLTNPSKAMIGYAVGNGEPTGINTYDLVENILKKDYNLKILNVGAQALIPDTFKLLMIVKPTISFSDSDKLKIDQFIMRGGKVLWFIDKLNAEMDSLQLKNQVIAFDRGLNLDDLLFKYGVRINSDLVMDLQCDYLPFNVNGKSQFEFLHWNYFPLFETHSNHQINKNLGLVAGKFVNSIDTVKAENITKTILLSSSSNSRSISTPALISGAENRNSPEDEAFKKNSIPVAVLLEGKFSSLFSNRLSISKLDTLDRLGFPFLSKNIQDNKMILISDGDIPLNGVTQKAPIPMGMNSYTVGTQYEYQFANKEFVENCLQYLINNNGLSEAKAKDYTLRLLDPKRINEERTKFQMINILAPCLFIILFGLIYQWWQSRRYLVFAGSKT
ncbi:MAG: gliding motility-associated ABC transporter substrate-binding protein GldG [Ginsengibacter sp.]